MWQRAVIRTSCQGSSVCPEWNILLKGDWDDWRCWVMFKHRLLFNCFIVCVAQEVKLIFQLKRKIVRHFGTYKESQMRTLMVVWQIKSCRTWLKKNVHLHPLLHSVYDCNLIACAFISKLRVSIHVRCNRSYMLSHAGGWALLEFSTSTPHQSASPFSSTFLPTGAEMICYLLFTVMR